MNIVFVCTGNTCRSVLGEGYMRAIAPEFSVSSCGIAASASYRVPAIVLNLIKEAGVDLSDHRSTQITGNIVSVADYIFVMENLHREYVTLKYPESKKKVFFLKEFAGLQGNPEIRDPIGQPDDVYIERAALIRDCVAAAYKKLKKEKTK